MSGEYSVHLTSGLTIYALIFDENRTKMWDGSAFTAISSIADADYADGAVACPEQETSDSTGTGVYVGDRPSGLAGASRCLVEFYSGSPSPGDTNVAIQFDTVITGQTGSIVSPTFMTLKVNVADMLGWGRNSEGAGSDWDTEDESRLDEAVRSGYWRFIYNAIVPGERSAHRWSFMEPVGSLATVASDYLYDMDSDFGAIKGDIHYDSAEDISRIIHHTTPAKIDRWRSQDDAEGRPKYFAIRPKALDQTAEQVKELMLYPTPDDAYDLVYYYHARFDDLSATNLYPLGGQEHRDTLIQSCRDVGAQFFLGDDAARQEREHRLYLERLQASVELDRRNAPDFLGYNDDRSGRVINRHGTEFTVSLTHNLGGGS